MIFSVLAFIAVIVSIYIKDRKKFYKDMLIYKQR